MSETSSSPNGLALVWRWIGLIQHGILRVFGLFLILFFILLVPGCIGAMIAGDEKFELADSGVLYFAPSGVIVEEETSVAPEDALPALLLGGGSPDEVLLRDVVEGFRLAAADDDVTAMIVNFDNLGGATPAAMHQIGQEMTAFREAGKEIIVYGDFFGMGSYFLAAHADEIHMHHMGVAQVNGYAVYRTFFRSFLDRFNVTVNVYRVGTFKSALEPFLGDEMSEAAAEANRFVFGDLWNAYQGAVESARGFDQGALQTYADTLPDLVEAAGGDLATVALEQGLVDAAVGRGAFRNQMQERFGKDADEDRTDASGFFAYLNDRRESASGGDGDTIAVITAVGGIIDGDADGGAIGGDAHAALIRRARLDDDVRAIVLRIDSGGGSAFASELIREELEQAKLDGKVVIASMGGVAASGGYWIATPAHEIWAEPTTITGSIGIFGFIPTLENTVGEYGIFEDGIALTDTARGPSAFGGVPESWDRILQSSIENGYEMFLSIVAESRGMTRDEVDAVAQGRIWTGSQAYANGLVDSLGGYDDAIAAAAERAGLEEGEYQVRLFEREPTEFEVFLENLGLEAQMNALAGSGLVGDGWFGDSVRNAAGELEAITLMNDPNHIYATCFECEAFRQAR
jgi:protease-4